MTGQQVVHVQSLERIYGGSMGVVYNAMDTCRNLVIALNILSEAMSGDAEARAASMPDHANICAVLDSDEH